MRLFGRKKDKRTAQGHATVVDAWKRNPGKTTGNCRIKLDLDDVPGVERQTVDHHVLMATDHRWPEVGMVVAVSVDPDDPTSVDPDWDSVFGEMRGGALGYLAEQAALAAGVDVDLSKGVPDDNVPGLPSDQIPARVAELNAQFARGEITYEQMAEQIQRAMGAWPAS